MGCVCFRDGMPLSGSFRTRKGKIFLFCDLYRAESMDEQRDHHQLHHLQQPACFLTPLFRLGSETELMCSSVALKH
ncbi:hypothetical protein DNTS_021611 [Danionella cerebrum]|uniref:Uncharacterized protein n=1 Tax=Danionella cerebrum TaxID=2873325 RepID=A0A553QXM6_9TELE|nr:hypothetical protein DNTS_021611 [Danionella translucida]